MRLSSWISKVCARVRPQTSSRRRGWRQCTVHSAVQRLEPRVLLSASPVGSETQVNSTTSGDQTVNPFGNSLATDADGDYVVTWTSSGQDGNGDGVYAQRFNAAGVAQGSEFRVNTTTVGYQFFSSVAMDADGDFVITWTDSALDGSLNGVYAQRYNAAGEAQGSEFRVNAGTVGDQEYSAVAMDVEGNFVVTWQSYGADGDGWGIYAQRYDAVGVAQGSQFRVNSTTTSDQQYASIAMDDSGDFVITWQSESQDGSGWGIYGQRFNSAGIAQGIEFLVNTTTSGDQQYASVAIDAAGDFVVSWSSDGQDGDGYGIYAQLYDDGGFQKGGEFLVNTTTIGAQNQPTVAMNAAGGFVVSWSSEGQDGSGSGIIAQQYTAAGSPLGTEVVVNSTTTDNQITPSVAMDANGDFLIGWSGHGEDGDGYGVYVQRFNEATETASPIVTGVFDGNRQIQNGLQLTSTLPALTIAFSENMSVAGGVGGINSVINPDNWQLIKDGVSISSSISAITFGFNAATNRYEAQISFAAALTAGTYQLTARPTIQDGSGNYLDGDQNGTPGGDFVLGFTIANLIPSGPEFQVNTTTQGNQQTRTNQQNGSIAVSVSGDFVITWESQGQDGSGYGVFAQRYNAAGVAVGSEFQVNTFTDGDQMSPTVAMDADGDFIITWTSFNQNGSDSGIYAQRYDSAGVAQGGEFLVSSIAENPVYSTVATDASGGFVIAWKAQDSSNWGIFAQRYNNAGVAQGAEFQVNSTSSQNQQFQSVAMDAAGDFVVAWTSDYQDGSYGGIYAQRYNAAGVAQGGEFRVNTTIQGSQYSSNVAMDAAGNFVVTWSSYLQDGSNFGVFAQRYNSEGQAQGSEFQVNTYTASIQSNSAVCMDADGDFVVTWSSSGEDGSGYGIYAQRYNSYGLPQGGETRVNSYTAGEQQYGSVATDATGNFVVTWTSSNQDGSGNGVFAQRFQSRIGPNLVVGGSETFTEGSGPIPIDPGIIVFDPESTTLASASITITNFVAGQDVLVFSNDGSSMGNIAAGSNANGMLTLISAGGTATQAEWQAALRSVSYDNSSNNPSSVARSVDFVVNDGVSDSNTLTSSVSVVAVNQAPVLSNVEPVFLPYAPNDPPVAVTSTLTPSDADSLISGATIQITSGHHIGDTLTFNNTANINGVFNAGTGTLTLTGNDTVANYQAALRSITYSSASNSPVARTISFQVTDGTDPSNIVSRTVGGYAQLVGSTVDVYGTSLTNNISVTEGATLDIVVDGVLTQFTPAQVTAIVIHGYAGDDSIQVNSLANGTALTAYGDAGNDTLRVNSVVTQAVTLDGGDDNDLLIGGRGSDIMLGGNGNDLLKGGDGFDDLSGGAGNDYLYGEGDTDNMRGGDGSDTLVGGAGNETYYFEGATTDETDTVVELVDGGFDQLYFGTMTTAVTANLTSDAAMATMSHRVVKTGAAGQAANLEIVTGGSGNDSITGNAAANFLMGGEGNDTIDGGDGDDLLLQGGGGDDILIGGSGNDSLLGDSGSDTLIGGTGNNSLIGGADDDVYVFGDAVVNQLDVVSETSDLGAGTGDTLDFSAMSVPVTINLTSDTTLAGSAHLLVQAGQPGQALNFENATGGSGNDSITGNSSVNVLTGNGGNDTLIGNDNDDWLYGGDGNDLLKGGNGNDRLNGNNQDDILQGGIGDDIVDGEAGNDLLDGGEGSDMLFGGSGSDTFVFGDAITNQVDSVNEQPEAPGTDTLNFSGLTTAVNVDLTSTSAMATMAHRIVGVIAGSPLAIENVTGGSGNDQITGNAANNLLMGGNGNDTLNGGAGNDILLGGAGNDVLKGISGRNILIGGTGGDVLQGGTDDDLLLSGSSTYESNPAILQALLTEWASANPYQTRIDHLLETTGGGANSTFILSPATVKTDADADYLAGNGGRDWFLANSLQDVITDRAVDEVFTQIDTWL